MSPNYKMIEVLPDLNALIERSLALVLTKLNGAIQERGQFRIVLSGGNTPKPLYAAMAKQDLPWEKIHVFWGDERYVPPDHPDSNQAMARHAWLDQVSIPPANIHPMPTDAADPATSAEHYETHLRGFFATQPGQIPAFDLVLLGLGDDGHTASLFPYTDALQVRDRLITVGNKDGQPRLTFTVPLINQARSVIFIVAGANKQAALSEIFATETDEFKYPARLIQPQGELWWLLDKAAGQGIESNGLKS